MILQTHDRNSVHILLQSTPDSIIDGIYVRTVSAARQKARWSWVRSAAETRPLTSPGATERHPAGKRTPRRTADGCLAEDSSAAAFHGSNVRLPWFLYR